MMNGSVFTSPHVVYGILVDGKLVYVGCTHEYVRRISIHLYAAARASADSAELYQRLFDAIKRGCDIEFSILGNAPDKISAHELEERMIKSRGSSSLWNVIKCKRRVARKSDRNLFPQEYYSETQNVKHRMLAIKAGFLSKNKQV